MHPELVHFPGGFSIKTYGFFLMIGFLSGVWMAMKRAEKVKANSDRVLDMAFLLLVFGVLGARIFYVVHYWKSQFAGAPNKLLAIIDITSGGLEFLGGFLGGLAALLVYCWWTKVSMRLYLDIAAPSAMWGLALGRIGCFFNGCCFGGMFAAGATAPPWAVQFPYGSGPQLRQWEERRVAVPAELVMAPKGALVPLLVPQEKLAMSIEKLQGPAVTLQEANRNLEQAEKAGAAPAEIDALKKAVAAATKAVDEHRKSNTALYYAMVHPSRTNPDRNMTVTELQDLAAAVRSEPIHPTQLYAAGQALLLSLLLSAIFYRRKRHGVVIAWLLMLYPIQRVLEEIIRADNPHDVAGLTVSQSISVAMFLSGLVLLFVLYRRLPERSPYAEEPEKATLAAAPA
jgi:phosphatidylglycerol:prolipoprotein diacylglycerol transferase